MFKQKKSFRFLGIGLGLAVLAIANGCRQLGGDRAGFRQRQVFLRRRLLRGCNAGDRHCSEGR